MPATATPPLVLVFPSRLPALRKMSDGGNAPASSWIQVAVVGDYEDPRYGKFSITREMLASMAANFSEGKFPTPPTEICVDYDHLTLKEAQRPGDAKAAGWFKQLETRSNGDELWARVEWTGAGAEAVKSAEYRFFSPAFRTDFVTNAGEHIGPTLINGAITNTPFLQGMAPVTLRSLAHRAGVASDKVVVLTTLTDNDKRWRLEVALQQRFGHWEYDYCCNVWLIDTIDGAEAVFQRDTAKFIVGYTFGDDGTVSFTGDPEEVVVTYSRLTAGDGGKSLMATIHLKAADGKAVAIDEKALEETDLVKSLRAQLPGKDQKVVPAAEYQALTSSVDELGKKVTALTATAEKAEADAKTANDALVRKNAETEVAALMAEGKITPAQKDTFIELRLSNEEMFKKLTGTLTKVVPLNDPKGSGEDADATRDPLQLKADEIRAADPKLTAEQAYAKALEQNKSLYKG